MTDKLGIQIRTASIRQYSCSGMDHSEEVENKHLSTKKTHGESVLTVKDQPVDSLENHKSSLEEMTDKLGIQIRTARNRHYSCSDMDQSEKIKNKHLNTKRPHGRSDLTV